MGNALLLSIVEIGGYPDFSPIYQAAGYEVTQVNSVRKALSVIKTKVPQVIVTEFNFQSDFRDRTSSIETLMASLQGMLVRPKLIVFFENEFAEQFRRVTERFPIDHTLSFPIDTQKLRHCFTTTEG